MNALERLIADKITATGPITFCEFMRLALYHPQLGYYNKAIQIGKSGADFYTNANVHPLFGAVIADAAVTCLKQISANYRKSIVEYGAGTGMLAFHILTTLQSDYPTIFESTDYVIVEQSYLCIQRQKEKLSEFGHVKWITNDQLAKKSINGFIYSNELIDAFPVNRLRLNFEELQEQFVSLDNDRLISLWLKPSSARIHEYLRENQVEMIPDQIVEINLNARKWLSEISDILNEGILLTIDYGDTANRLFSAKRMHGSLRSFSSHELNDDPFLNVGQQDITASVNFSDLISYGETVGLEKIELTNQSEWLIKNGLINRAEALQSKQSDMVAIIECRQALKDFLVPGGISDNFKVLTQRRLRIQGSRTYV
jgi:SAM-dependent MidA family methyltransferase